MSVPPSPTLPAAPAVEPCAACGAPLANDQRYCLQCGELRHGARRALPAVLRGSIHGGRESGIVATNSLGGGERRPSLAAALAGIACLLLAMGVGVLIGRGGGAGATAPAPITIAGSPAAAATAPAAFTSDWPAGKDGWTIALAVLPKASTQPDAVAAAKSAASGQGAADVGALDSDAYPSLTSGSYVVYSGVYDAEKAATTALTALKAKFADARVVRVAATASPAASSTSSSDGASKSTSSPAAKKGAAAAGDTKKAFEDSKKAPKTVGTGGKPPPTDNRPAGGGSDVEEIG